MPLDGHAYLVSQGWEGKGTGLRKGAIAKPVTVIQKKSLSGVGKDRDDAFPFWDHVFSSAASAIKIKTNSSDDESDNTDDTPENVMLRRTRTGIISNRRPQAVTSALPTPGSSSSSGASTPRMSILAAAKQEAARRNLYSMFFRGPIMRSDDPTPTPESSKSKMDVDKVVEAVTEKLDEVKKQKRRKEKGKDRARDEEAGDSKEEVAQPSKKRKAKKEKDTEGSGEQNETTEERRERKRRKLKQGGEDDMPEPVTSRVAVDDSALAKAQEKAERRERREEKRARKEERRKRRAEREEAARTAAELVAEDTTLPGQPDLTVSTTVPIHLGASLAEDPSDTKVHKKKRKKDRAS